MTARERILSACFGLVLPGIVATGMPAVAADANGQADENAKTTAAVIAVDDHWMEAEMSGDTAWLDAMLLPEYRSISADGKPADKQKILAGAARNRGSDKMRKQVDAWLKAHPTRKSVVMQGDVATTLKLLHRHVIRRFRLSRWRLARDLFPAQQDCQIATQRVLRGFRP